MKQWRRDKITTIFKSKMHALVFVSKQDKDSLFWLQIKFPKFILEMNFGLFLYW